MHIILFCVCLCVFYLSSNNQINKFRIVSRRWAGSKFCCLKPFCLISGCESFVRLAWLQNLARTLHNRLLESVSWTRIWGLYNVQDSHCEDWPLFLLKRSCAVTGLLHLNRKSKPNYKIIFNKQWKTNYYKLDHFTGT